MNKIEKWFNEAEQTCNVHKDTSGHFIIYKGIKLQKTEDGYYILDVRFQDMYSNLSKEDLYYLDNYGFIMGADIISYNRSMRRVKEYTLSIEQMFDKLKDIPSSDKSVKSIKRKKNLNKNIDNNIDLIFLYGVKIEGVLQKYTNNNVFNNAINNKN